MKKTKLQKAFHELKKNPPAILAKTKKKKGVAQANKQRIAIALSKARKSGANVPQKPSREDVLKRIKERMQNA